MLIALMILFPPRFEGFGLLGAGAAGGGVVVGDGLICVGI